jgi:hypothetical protein
VDFKLGHATANRYAVAKVAVPEGIEALQDTSFAGHVLQAREPSVKSGGAVYRVHGSVVFMWIQQVKANLMLTRMV